MPTNDERRDVAARLRELDTSRLYDGMDEVCALEDACGCDVGQDWQDMELKDRLAELIETESERTCHFRNDGHGIMWCDAQGCDYDMDEYFPIPNYCPNCGAKVVE